MKAAIGYLRVSTPEQGRSGIGLAAQRAEIEAFGNGAGFAIKFWHQDIHKEPDEMHYCFGRALRQRSSKRRRRNAR